VAVDTYTANLEELRARVSENFSITKRFNLQQKIRKQMNGCRFYKISITLGILYVQMTVHRDNLRVNNQQDASNTYFPTHTTHRDFFVKNFGKNSDECILILVIYWKKTGLLH
jgi:hypothetical protein